MTKKKPTSAQILKRLDAAKKQYPVKADNILRTGLPKPLTVTKIKEVKPKLSKIDKTIINLDAKIQSELESLISYTKAICKEIDADLAASTEQYNENQAEIRKSVKYLSELSEGSAFTIKRHDFHNWVQYTLIITLFVIAYVKAGA